MSSGLVDLLGMIAGGVWLSAAIYFQMVRSRSVDPANVLLLLSIGISLVLSSGAVAALGPGTVELFAMVANSLFIVIGVGVWFALERAAELEDRKQATDQDALYQQ